MPGSRLSSGLWQPGGLDVDALAAERAATIDARRAAGRQEEEYFRRRRELRQHGLVGVSSSQGARARTAEADGAEEFGAALGYRDPHAAPPSAFEPEPEPEPVLQNALGGYWQEDTAAGAAAAAPPPAAARDVVWLLEECVHSLVAMGLEDASELQAAELAIKTKRLLSSAQADDAIQGEMLDLLGFDRLDFISELLEHRRTLAQLSVPSQPKKLLKSVEKKRSAQPRSGGASQAAHSDFVATSRAAFGRPGAAAGPLKQMGWSDGVDALIGGGISLPAGATQSHHKDHDEWEIPPTPTIESVRRETGAESDIPLVAVKTLPRYAQQVLHPIPSLNRLQSSCFQSAFHSSENLLVCAPTGSGKTNVAMLTVLRELGRHLVNGSLPPDAEPFKIVYLAPLKALATEVTTKFSRALSVLGVKVKELTGDTKLSRAEIAKVHILVATPEKWDVMTRKSGDIALTSQLRLLIIDEVHLLHEERGAVLETLVVRTLRQMELSQSMIRIAALSATLPNYRDVAAFLHVEESGLFFFDSAYRPVPLAQHFIGVKKQQNPYHEKSIMTNLAWRKVAQSVAEGNQCLVFVHARNETVRTAQEFLGKMREEGKDYSAKDECETWNIEAAKVAKSRNNEMRELFLSGLGTHHAGMLRPDRLLMERMFEKGLVKVLVATATLSWGVNLPAHTVVIKGTEIYDSKAGGFVEMSMQDVMQCFGRAGRPQYDTSGEGIIITTHDKLPHYLRLLNSGLPIESQYLQALSNHLNAEVVLGNVTSIDEAVEWLRYTYLWTRAVRSPNPLEYGITLAERQEDPDLQMWRRKLVTRTAENLFKSRMIIYLKDTGQIRSTALGRVASHFYVDHGTVETFADPTTGVCEYMADADILGLVGMASEFSGVKVRQEELEELDALQREGCEVDVKGGVEHAHGKVNVLLQAYLSQLRIKSFSLVIDQMYVAREAGRLLRALFEMTFYSMARQTQEPFKGWVDSAMAILALCKALERRSWHTRHPLAQLAGQPGISPDVLGHLETHKGWLEVDKLRSMSPEELDAHFGAGKVNRGRLRPADIERSLMYLPVLRAETELRPITRIADPPAVVVRVDVFLSGDFTWSSRMHGGVESWLVYAQDDKSRLLHFESLTIRKEDYEAAHRIRFHLQIPDPAPPPFFLFAESESWIGLHTVAEISFDGLVLPASSGSHTAVRDVPPLPLETALDDPKLAAVIASGRMGGATLNQVQTHVFEAVYKGDDNLLVAAAAGNGHTTCAELAICRALGQQPKAQVLFLSPKQATVSVLAADWHERLGGVMGYKVGLLIDGKDEHNSQQLREAQIICASAAQWERLVCRDPSAAPKLPRLALVVIDGLHLMGDGETTEVGDGGRLELALSQWMCTSAGGFRVVGLAGAALATDSANDLGGWLGVEPRNICNFSNGIRPTTQELIVKKFDEKRHTPRLAAMNKPVFQTLQKHSDGPALVFVSSRSQCWLTAIDIIALATASAGGVQQFVGDSAEILEGRLRAAKAQGGMRNMLRWGVGLHYPGMHRSDRRLVSTLFAEGLLRVVIATPDLAWSTTERQFSAGLVIIKGTERYNAPKQRFEAYHQSAVLQMIGRAARRPAEGQAKDQAKVTVVVMCQDILKEFWVSALFCPMPLESGLRPLLPVAPDAEAQARALLTHSFLRRRVASNPSYYAADPPEHAGDEPKPAEAMVTAMISESVAQALSSRQR